MNCDDCKTLGIPERLCKGDRVNITEWEDSELLYRRHNNKGKREDLIKDPEVVLDMFKIHDDSYNRSSLSRPEDVLLNDDNKYSPDIYVDYGIIQISVSELVSKCVHQINNDNRVFQLVAVHDSKDCNYSHSEIHCFVDGVKATKKPKSLNAVFRQILLGFFLVTKEKTTH
jgi:hypothetical protein